MRARARWVATLLAGTALVLGGCSGGEPAAPPKPPAPPAKLSSSLPEGSKDVQVNTKLTLTASDGTLGEVKLVDKDGKTVDGQVGADKKTWTSSGRLEFGQSYSYDGKAVNADGKATDLHGTFSTVPQGTMVRGMINIDDNGTVGIAQPVIIQFSGHVEDRVAAQKALSVKSDPPTTGSWGWLPDNDTGSRVHWRPEKYWAPGTKVSVTANLYGVPYGQGRYGKDDVTSTFVIGRSQIVRADVNTHRMTVIRDGKEVATYDASMGSGASEDRVTRSGIHVVTEKWEDKIMSNPPYYTNVRERWAVRISNNGEFIHANPGTVGNQGNSNVTHGCINLSTANAQEYFGTALMGDPVEVTGSSVALSAADGDIYDWALDWSQWQALSALR